jgi:predicted secreted protein
VPFAKSSLNPCLIRKKAGNTRNKENIKVLRELTMSINRGVQTKSSSVIKQLIDGIIQAGHMTRQEHLNLTSTLLSEQKMSDEDRIQINRVFDYIQTGRLKLVD